MVSQDRSYIYIYIYLLFVALIVVAFFFGNRLENNEFVLILSALVSVKGMMQQALCHCVTSCDVQRLVFIDLLNMAVVLSPFWFVCVCACVCVFVVVFSF